MGFEEVSFRMVRILYTNNFDFFSFFLFRGCILLFRNKNSMMWRI